MRLARSQPASAGELLDFIEDIKDRHLGAVLAEERVRARMKGAQHRLMGVDFRLDKPKGNEPCAWLADVGIYDYDKDVLVVAVVDLRKGAVVAVEERPGVQPPVTEEELAAATRLVPTSHAHHARLNQPGTTVVAFPTPRYVESHARAKNRCVTLYFSDEPEAQVTLDLKANQVVPQEELVSSPRLNLGSSPTR